MTQSSSPHTKNLLTNLTRQLRQLNPGASSRAVVAFVQTRLTKDTPYVVAVLLMLMLMLGKTQLSPANAQASANIIYADSGSVLSSSFCGNPN